MAEPTARRLPSAVARWAAPSGVADCRPIGDVVDQSEGVPPAARGFVEGGDKAGGSRALASGLGMIVRQGSIRPMKMLQQALTRRRYRRRGYQVFRGAFEAGTISAVAELAREVASFAGKLRRQDDSIAVNAFYPGTMIVRNSLAHPHLSLPSPLDGLSLALRQLVTSPSLASCLRSLDGERHYIVHQVLLFFGAQDTDLHLDSWSVDTSPRGRSHTVWIPLHDMGHLSGVPCVIPWPRREVITEGELGLTPGSADPYRERYELYHRALRARLLGGSPEIVTALVRAGDFMTWSSLTPHFTMPSRPFPAERLSVQVLIRPADLRWGNFLEQPYDRNSVQLERVSEDFSIVLHQAPRQARA